jgi:DNA invertase Pin-like site-specific DNA recombinase
LARALVAGVLASLAELELELGRERRTAARDARRVRGQSASTIAATVGVSRATVYRVLAAQTDDTRK